jgi:hypothetical protein
MFHSENIVFCILNICCVESFVIFGMQVCKSIDSNTSEIINLVAVCTQGAYTHTLHTECVFSFKTLSLKSGVAEILIQILQKFLLVMYNILNCHWGGPWSKWQKGC